MVSARRGDPLSSFAAADTHSAARVSKVQGNVLDLLASHGQLTPEMVTKQYKKRVKGGVFVKASAARVRSVLPELERDGFVRRADHKVKNKRGINVTVWEVVAS